MTAMSAPTLKRWETATSTGSHFDVLDGLRGMAILLVVAFHTLYVNPDAGFFARLFNWAVIQAGWMGVPVFFVLSGFLISYPFFQRREEDPRAWYMRGYATRRAAKILPPFYLSILFFMGFYWLNYHDPAYFNSAWKWAAGLGNFIPIKPEFNGVYWSLLIESHFYIILPLLFWLLRGLSSQRTGIILFGIFFFVPLITRHLVWPDNIYVLPDYTSELYAETSRKLIRFPAQLDYFGWGILFAAMFVSLGKKAGLELLRPLSILGYAGAGLMAVTLAYWGLWQDQFDIRTYNTQWSIEISHLLPAVATMLMLFFIFDPKCLGARFFCMGWLRFTGIISFEWFLFHGPIANWIIGHYPGHTHGNVLAYAWRAILPLVVTFTLAALVYRYFSLPILNRVRDRLKKQTNGIKN